MDLLLKYFTDFSSLQLKQLEALEDVYKEWNEKINVISRKDIDHLYERHVLHSLSIAAVFSFKNGSQIVDLGCGGGFPAIPLAVFFPEVQFHLVDSISKKLKVAEAVAKSIGLSNITTEHARIEALKAVKFDFVVSRAVAPLKQLWLWSKPLIKRNINADLQATTERLSLPGGKIKPGLICLKGGDLAQEIAESHTRPYVLPISEIFTEPYFESKYMVYVPA